jgi:hypothetical protein
MTGKWLLASFALVAALALGGFTAVQAGDSGSGGATCDGPPCCGDCER